MNERTVLPLQTCSFLSPSSPHQAEVSKVSFIQVALLSIPKNSQRRLKRWLRAMFPEDPGSISSIHMAVFNCLQLYSRGPDTLCWLVAFKHTCGTQTCIQAKRSFYIFSPEAQVSINTALMFVSTLSTSQSLHGKMGVTGKKLYSYFSITGISDNL